MKTIRVYSVYVQGKNLNGVICVTSSRSAAYRARKKYADQGYKSTVFVESWEEVA